jgi:hypothetical protein
MSSAPERGDANWLDQQGSYMATVAAEPAFRLLGARGIVDTNNYRVAEMPPVNTGLLMANWPGGSMTADRKIAVT